MTAGLETFAKVRALHDRTTSAGEKASAASRMEALARAAGMTVAEAVSKLDAPPPKPKPKTQAQATANAFAHFFNTPEMRAARAEQDRARQERRAEILKRYGSSDAVYDETEREAALRVACEPMTIWDREPDCDGNYTLDGWGILGARDKVPPRVRAAVAAGWPLPRTVKEAWAEYIAAEERENDRQTMHDYEHFPALWSEVRRYVVEDLLDTLPAASIADMLIRQTWMEHLNEMGFSRDVNRDAVLLTTLRADIERMGQRLREQDAERGGETPPHQPVQSGQPEAHAARHTPSGPDRDEDGLKSQPMLAVHSGHPRRTNADKRRDVMALLNAGIPGIAGLTDREIARRAGVSPTTVGTIRRLM